MLSLSKLRQGQESYYLGAVVGRAEDYYVRGGEAPGAWVGSGAEALQLAGDVDAARLHALLTSRHPADGRALGRAGGTVPGYDLTFSAPKTVSLLWALGDDALSAVVQAAHDTAVRDALAYLERVAARGRRGAGGAMTIETDGLIAAAFRHRTSRAGDPQLHTHVLVANLIRGRDGRWGRLDARRLYVQQKTAGTLYQTRLRYELRELGLSWTVAATGLGELDAIPPGVRRDFSRRRVQIESALSSSGLSSAKAAEVATLESRPSKSRATTAELTGEWRRRATVLGLSQAAVDDLLERGRQARARRRYDRGDSAERLAIANAVSPAGLTAGMSTFTQQAALRYVANGLPEGATVERVQELVDQLLRHDEVIALAPVPPGPPGSIGEGDDRWTTRELLALERRLVANAVAGMERGSGLVATAALDEALAARHYLSAEQVAMVRQLVSSGHGVQVVNAQGGAGKTTALGAAVDAWQRQGLPTFGTSLSARAAGLLGDETGLRTSTLARLLADLELEPLAPGTVLVVDEAGQVGTRAMAVLEAAVSAAGGSLVLVGDVHQLPEIEAGGAFAALLRRLPVVELTRNQRQVEPAERDRLAELRRGNVAAAMQSYDEASRVTRSQSSEASREVLVRDWAAAFLSREGAAARADVVMLGLTNGDVRDLNRRAQRLLVEAGAVSGPALVVGDEEFRVGDHVVSRRNDRRLGVLNGQPWLVTRFAPDGSGLELQGLTGPDVARVPATYLAAGHLQHGYALTTALSQGRTVDQSFVLGSDATYREAGYTAASRARARTQFYVVRSRDVDADEGCHRAAAAAGEGVDPLSEFVRSLEQSRRQSMAFDHLSSSGGAR